MFFTLTMIAMNFSYHVNFFTFLPSIAKYHLLKLEKNMFLGGTTLMKNYCKHSNCEKHGESMLISDKSPTSKYIHSIYMFFGDPKKFDLSFSYVLATTKQKRIE